MKIHANRVTANHVYLAAFESLRGVRVHDVETHGSRTHAHRLDVVLEGVGERHTRWANSGGYGSTDFYAATHDDWGLFLAALYKFDSSMRCVDTGYTSRAAFHELTNNRYNPWSEHYLGGQE